MTTAQPTPIEADIETAPDDLTITELVVPITAKYRYDRGVALAAKLARRWNLPVRLVHVDTTPCHDDAVAVPVGGHIGEARARLKAQNPNIEVGDEVVAGGNIARAIAEALTPNSMVVMATDEAGDAVRQTSHAEALAQHWRGPIVLVGPRARTEGPWAPVLLTLDGSPFGEQALPWARTLAQDFGLPLKVMQVVNAETVAKVAELKSSGQTATESGYVRRVTDELNASDCPAEWEIVHQDDAVDGILEYLANSTTGLVLMSTHGATGVARVLYGSTCMGVVREAPCPVVIIHPEYVAPKQLHR